MARKRTASGVAECANHDCKIRIRLQFDASGFSYRIRDSRAPRSRDRFEDYRTRLRHGRHSLEKCNVVETFVAATVVVAVDGNRRMAPGNDREEPLR